MARRHVAFRKKRQNRTGMLMVSLVVLMLMVVMVVKCRELSRKQAVYEERKATLSEQIAQEEKRTEDLIAYEKFTKTTKYVEEVAKDKLGLVFKDEIIFESKDEE